MYRFVHWGIVALLCGALAVALLWLVKAPDFEPAVTAIALLASLIGIFVDNWARTRARRRTLLRAVVHELYTALNVLKDPVFTRAETSLAQFAVFPRIHTGAVDHALVSGEFDTHTDAQLHKLMHSWTERARDFNNRLSITEFFCMSRGPEATRAMRSRLVSGAVARQVRRATRLLAERLVDGYSSESGIGRDTVLFGEPGDQVSGIGVDRDDSQRSPATTDPLPAAFTRFASVAAIACVFELKIRLAAQLVSETQIDALGRLSKVVQELGQAHSERLEPRQLTVLVTAAKLRNKLLHADFRKAVDVLEELGRQPTSASVWQVDLETGEAAELSSLSSQRASIRAWLIKTSSGNAFPLAEQIFADAIDTIHKLVGLPPVSAAH